MGRKYYYLISGLPNFIDGTKGFDYAKIRDEIVELLADDDLGLLKFLQLDVDNQNIANILEKKNEFDTRAWFTKGELDDLLNDDTNELPDYIQKFLEDRKNEKESVQGLGVYEQLSYLYFEELREKSAWFGEWVDFTIDLKNVVAAFSAREMGVSVEKSLLQLNDNAEKILKSRATDFGMASTLPWLESISKNINSPVALEEAIDDIYFKKVDEMAQMPDTEFGMESVLGFMVKANRIERWRRLDTEKGKARVSELIENLKKSLEKQEN